MFMGPDFYEIRRRRIEWKRLIRLPPNEAPEMPKAPKNAPPDQHASEAGLAVTPDDVRAAAAAIPQFRHRHRMRPEPDAERDLRLPSLAQIREPAVHLDLQGARRAQSAAGAVAGRTAARRDRDVGRQSCAGRGLSRASARHSRQHRDAGRHADGEDREHQASRRGDDHFRQDAGGGRRVRARAWQGAEPHHDPPLRRSA